MCKTNPFSLALQECSSEFLASIKSGLKKNVLLSLFSEIVANLIGKGLSWSHLIKLIGLQCWIYTLLKKIVSYIFQRMFRKTVVLKVLGKSLSLLLFNWKSSFQAIWDFQSTLHEYTENCLHRKCFLWVFPIRLLRERLCWTHFCEVSLVEQL